MCRTNAANIISCIALRVVAQVRHTFFVILPRLHPPLNVSISRYAIHKPMAAIPAYVHSGSFHNAATCVSEAALAQPSIVVNLYCLAYGSAMLMTGLQATVRSQLRFLRQLSLLPQLPPWQEVAIQKYTYLIK